MPLTPREQGNTDLAAAGRSRRAGVSAESVPTATVESWTKPVFDKNDSDKELLKDIINNNQRLQVFFGHLQPEAVDDVIMAMYPKVVPAGTDVIAQGDVGDACYIVSEGSLEVFVKRDPSEAGKGGKVMDLGPGSLFGELALLYNAPRAATVTSTSEVKLWGLDSDSFRMMLRTADAISPKENEDFVESCSAFSILNRYEKSELAGKLQRDLFDADEIICDEGDDAECLYILEDGVAAAFDKDGKELRRYTEAGSIFGEVALLNGDLKRTSTLKAMGQGCTVFTLDGETFDTGVAAAVREEITPSTRSTYVATHEDWTSGASTRQHLGGRGYNSPAKLMMQGGGGGGRSGSNSSFSPDKGGRYVTTRKVPFGSNSGGRHHSSTSQPPRHRYSSPSDHRMFSGSPSPPAVSSGARPSVSTGELKTLKTSLTLLKSKMSATAPGNQMARIHSPLGDVPAGGIFSGSRTIGGPYSGNRRAGYSKDTYADDSPKERYYRRAGNDLAGGRGAAYSPEVDEHVSLRRQHHSSGPSIRHYKPERHRFAEEQDASSLNDKPSRRRSAPQVSSGVVVIGEAGVGEYPEEQMRMVKCHQCGRSFKEDSLEKHEKVCRKVFKEKRREFNAVATRLQEFENKEQLIRKALQEKKKGPQRPKPTKWKQQSEAFRAAIASCRSSDPFERQLAAEKFAELQAEHERQHMVKCPHCGRTFHDEASKRHIPICQKTFANGGGRLMKGRGGVAHSTAARRDSRGRW
ncbi:zinc finger, C2HC-type containing [Perkinsus chesapeaki]|uniref:Zinc finger, C2HC-type containing n=1 Tax=Perkinsus chesapeaki TaxID=330153 RepID=A0A7J6MA22_PERCH|nr:zinc finger, C2HC-type containing [Perkinsus chesapeaki]